MTLSILPDVDTDQISLPQKDGIVVQSSYKYDNGEFVTIDHGNGYYSLYAHKHAI